MKYHKPSFFDQFKCIGSACTDTCCAGWEIEVDDVFRNMAQIRRKL